MVLHSYKSVVLDSLKKKSYPVLYDYVIIIVYFKWISPSRSVSTKVIENSKYHLPEILYEKENKELTLLYFEEGNKNIVACELENFNISEDCAPNVHRKNIRLRRNDLCDLLKVKCSCFEEEIYLFIKHLNIDVPKIGTLLDLNFEESTRFIPISFKICVDKFFIKPIDSSCKLTDPHQHFGPSYASNHLDTREVNGNISASASKDTILSLNDDINWKEIKYKFAAELQRLNPYIIYYSVRWQTVFPLAYNPLENPIIT